MTAPVAYPSRLLQVGIAKETGGYGVAAAPTLGVPNTEQTPAKDNVSVDPDVSWRGSPVDSYGHQPGAMESTFTLGGPVYADVIGFPLAGILGDVSFAAGSPNTWTMALLTSGTQQPSSYTVTVADAINCVQYPGCRFGQVKLSITADGLLTWQATGAGLPSNPPIAAPPISFSTLLPMVGWRGQVQIGGSSESRLVAADITLTRALTVKRPPTGQQAPTLQRAETLSVGGTLTLAAKDDSYRQNYLAGSQTSLDLYVPLGSGAGLQSLRLHCSKVFMTALPKSYGGKWIEYQATFVADGNTTDVGASGGYSPIKATLQNSVASGTY